ncbi:MAG: twin-arginine translocase TatA/TatE family subunit [Ignavibacteria bacterium]|nr:twin-arginine translocase TatA/TatE family subunit [Ignavibacteria bacterium]
MFDVGGGELLLIFVAVLLLFGPKKIPEVMRSVGKGLRQFRQAQEDLKQQMRDLSSDVEKMTEVQETVHIAPKPVIDDSINSYTKPSFETEHQFPAIEAEPIIPTSEQTLTIVENIEPKSLLNRQYHPFLGVLQR